MNKVILMGRLTKDPEVRYSQGEQQMAIARYALAVDRQTKDHQTDFIQCVAFGACARFAEQYLTKGMKILVAGRLQTGSYTNRDGVKVHTTEVVVGEHYFAEGKKAATQQQAPKQTDQDGFYNADGEDLPFT